MERIDKRAFPALTAYEIRTIVSAATIWEVAIKRNLGKLIAPGDLLSQLERSGVALLPVTARHADVVATLPHTTAIAYAARSPSSDDQEADLGVGSTHIGRYGMEVIW